MKYQLLGNSEMKKNLENLSVKSQVLLDRDFQIIYITNKVRLENPNMLITFNKLRLLSSQKVVNKLTRP